MAFWMMPPQAHDRDSAAFFTHDIHDSTEDYQHDFLGEFVDLDHGPTQATSSLNADGYNYNTGLHESMNPAMPTMLDTTFLGNAHPAGSTSSSGFSTADDFDFLSSSSQLDAVVPSEHQDVDPKTLVVPSDYGSLQEPNSNASRASTPEMDLARLDGMSLHSPTKDGLSSSRAVSPSHVNGGAQHGGRGRKFVESLSATVKKAAGIRRGRKPQPLRDQSPPGNDDRMGSLRPAKQRQAGAKKNGVKTAHTQRAATTMVFPSPPPEGMGNPTDQGFGDDPFVDYVMPPRARYMSQGGFDHPLESPGIHSDAGAYSHDVSAPSVPDAWPLPNAPNSAPAHWNDPTVQYLQDQGISSAGQIEPWDNQHSQHQLPSGPASLDHNAQINMMMHSHQAGLPYEYAGLQDTSSAGLMIQMPQPRQGSLQSTIVTDYSHDCLDANQHAAQQSQQHGGVDIALSEHTYLPPPPPIPDSSRTTGSPDRSHRPPRARSAGARHLSCSPTRNRPRAPSASPKSQAAPGSGAGTVACPQTPRSQTRHASSGSISSVRSASGRLPGSMPGTPCSVRKRKSRDVSASYTTSGATSVSSTAAAAAAAALGMPNAAAGSSAGRRSPSKPRSRQNSAGDFGGFVNFTPHDGASLMTGVAPSGSSKTKARREKEAMERRRKMSEAAMKAVAAAGGDVDKLLQEGFEF